MVEQYLHLAGTGPVEMHQPETVLVAEDVVEEEEDGDCELELCSRDGVSEAVQSGEGGCGGDKDDMLVCLEEHEAAQFLAVYNLIKNSFASPDSMYGMQFS